MNIKIFFVLGIVSCSAFSHNNDDVNKFYSTSFLNDYRAVRKSLRKIGFQPITFTTTDNFSLTGLFLSRPHATCNVIICAGWLPGRKEGMATFCTLLPEHCNILLFDARGHGQSDGSLLWKLWRYGVDEYKDILGAIIWINNNNQLPIIIGGICSGAFNAAHAIIHLEKNNLLEQCNVKGLIFDSGWGSVVKIITTAPVAGVKKRLVAALRCIYTTKKAVENSYIYQLSSCLATHMCSIGYHLAARALTAQYDHLTNLHDKIHHISIPIFFIHSYGDTYADMNDALELAAVTPNKECWWITNSSHAKHHLIHKDTYKEKLEIFITTLITS